MSANRRARKRRCYRENTRVGAILIAKGQSNTQAKGQAKSTVGDWRPA
jgi:hypothetical protein